MMRNMIRLVLLTPVAFMCANNSTVLLNKNSLVVQAVVVNIAHNVALHPCDIICFHAVYRSYCFDEPHICTPKCIHPR